MQQQTTHQARKLRFAPEPPPYPPPNTARLPNRCAMKPCPLPAYLPGTLMDSLPPPYADCSHPDKSQMQWVGPVRAKKPPSRSKLCGEVMREHQLQCKVGSIRPSVAFDPDRYTVPKPDLPSSPSHTFDNLEIQGQPENTCSQASCGGHDRSASLPVVVLPKPSGSGQVHSMNATRRIPQYRRFKNFTGGGSMFSVWMFLTLLHVPLGTGELRLSPSGCNPGEGVHFSSSGEILCEECPANSWNPAFNETCILCPPGKSSSGTPMPDSRLY